MLSLGQAREVAEAFRTKSVEGARQVLLSILSPGSSTSHQFYLHPLGFMYAKLHEFQNQNTIRLHIWSTLRHPQKPIMDVHNHYYKVNSYVIVGTMSNQLYQIRTTDSPTHAAYFGAYDESGNRVLAKSHEHVSVNESTRQIIQSKCFYSIGVDEFHASYVHEDAYTATLVLTEDPGIPRPTVFGPIDGAEQYYFINDSVPIDVVEREMAKLRAVV
jgi:hypothetical protein